MADSGDLFACFGSDPVEVQRKYLETRKRLLMFFECSLLSDPEGLTQEVFLRAQQSVASGKSIYAEDPCAFFLGIARRVRFEEWKKRRPESVICEDSPMNAMGDGHVSRIENAVYIRELLARANPRDRSLLVASYEGGNELHSAGEQRRLRVLLHRARKRMRKIAGLPGTR